MEIGFSTSVALSGYSGPFATAATGSALQTSDTDSALMLIGDSTGNGNDEWFYRYLTMIMAKYPAKRVEYQLWNDATKDYDATVVLQPGPTASERYIQFGNGANGAATNGPSNRTIPSTDFGVPVGDVLDISIKVALDNWQTGTNNQTLVSRYSGSAATNQFRWYVASDGRLRFSWLSTAGTASDIALGSALGFSAGTPQWLRVTFDPTTTNGTVTCYKSTDGVNWTTVGTGSGTGGTGLQSVVWDWELGARAGTVDPLYGKVYKVLIRDGLLGPVMNPQPITAWYRRTGRIDDGNTVGGDPTLFVTNGSQPGAGITGQLVTPPGIGSYLLDNAAKMARPYQAPAVFLATSHNEGAAVGKAWLSVYQSWVTALRAKCPYGGFIALTENPEVGGTATFHAKRVRELMTFSAGLNVTVIDTYSAFFKNGAIDSTLIDPDNIHPVQPAGHVLWATTVWNQTSATF